MKNMIKNIGLAGIVLAAGCSPVVTLPPCMQQHWLEAELGCPTEERPLEEYKAEIDQKYNTSIDSLKHELGDLREPGEMGENGENLAKVYSQVAEAYFGAAKKEKNLEVKKKLLHYSMTSYSRARLFSEDPIYDDGRDLVRNYYGVLRRYNQIHGR